MATGSLRRHSTDPSVEISVTQGGSALDLTDFKAKFSMWFPTTLSVAADTTTTHIVLPVASYAVAESSDVVVINHERMQITAVPASEPTTTANFTVSREYTIPSTKGTVYGSTIVAGTGANIFVLGDVAEFQINIDGGGATTVTLSSARTSSNYLMSHLVTDVQAAIDSVTTPCTVSNVGYRLYIETDTEGTAGSLIISSVDAIATAQLGLANDTDYGENSITCDATSHAAAKTVRIIKINQDARISSATEGEAEYEWHSSSDTDKIGTFYCTFSFLSDSGRFFEIPLTDSYSIEILADPNDRLLLADEGG